MTYAATVGRLATRTAAATVALLALPPAAFVVAAAMLVASANQTAASLADVALARMLRDALPLGLARPEDDFDRLERNLDLIVGGGEQEVRDRVERLAESEPLDAARAAYGAAMAEHGVVGWTRQAQPGACALCRSLADGSVLPINAAMYDHPHDRCIAVPVVPADRVAEGVPTTPVPVGTPLRTLQTGHGIGTTTYAQVEPGLVFVTMMRRVEA